MMNAVQKMRSIPLDFPDEIMQYAARIATGNRNFVSWLQSVEDDVIQRTFAFRKLKGKELEITEVMRRITDNENYLIKNLYGGYFFGYHAVYQKEDKKWISRGYPYIVFSAEDFDVWDECSGKPLGLWSKAINPEILQNTRFRYCGYDASMGCDVISYLNMYIEHPCVEYFGKMGISPTMTLIRTAERDKAFRKWLYRNRNGASCYGSKAILYAYKHHISVNEASDICFQTDRLNRETAALIPEIKGTKLDRKKVQDYVRNNAVGWSNYNDYLKALKKLNYDLADTKNSFPRDFGRMHDLRIAEYDSVMAKEDAEKRKQLYADFAVKAQEAKCLEYQSDGYAAVIPEQVGELVKEGRALHHCVGQMGYDKKMAEGKVIIVFVRSIEDLLKPLVTLEYDLKKHRILQAHGDHHRAPTDTERAFIDEWEQRTTEKLQIRSK